MTCEQCGQPATGRLCQMCEVAQANEKLHGTVDDEAWTVDQRGLDGEPAQGQVTLDGDLVMDGESDD